VVADKVVVAKVLLGAARDGAARFAVCLEALRLGRRGPHTCLGVVGKLRETSTANLDLVGGRTEAVEGRKRRDVRVEEVLALALDEEEAQEIGRATLDEHRVLRLGSRIADGILDTLVLGGILRQKDARLAGG